ncbi:uncharacterized protein SCO4629-like [Saccostrea echinata]|uniref:uncharacterized protein SCO4629-like n=1 Tax=Saccostrea echinata TaxID=191078 RepID=UPI002A807D9B|nr:uncharacterized protein SCO4629-like [Saccostrea echinata]
MMNNFHLYQSPWVIRWISSSFKCALRRNLHCTKSSSFVPDDHKLLAKKIWDYLILGHEISKSDVILVLGNHDLRTAEHGASLWLQGVAPWILFSGKEGANTRGKWTKPEAEIFKDVAISLGVNKNKILLEPHATNTGENVRFSYNILQQRNLLPKEKILLVQMPYMERRVYATFMKQWSGFSETPNLQVLVTSPRIPMLSYPNTEVGSLCDVISAMIGCLYRIQIYPQKGFQIPQTIPDTVLQSYKKLLQTNMYNDLINI